MKLLLFLHELAIGGTSVNAIELGKRLERDHGYEVALFAPPGPMSDWVERCGLRWFPAPAARMHPCVPRMKALREAVRVFRPDLLHVWETWALMDAFFGVHVTQRVPLLVTDMQMHVARVLPRSIPFTFGTPRLVDRARGSGMRNVRLLLPPVDTVFNATGTHDADELRDRLGVPRDALLYVIVSRLAHEMKGESIRYAIRAMDAIAAERDARLLIVGDGAARDELAALAAGVNQARSRDVVLLTGASLDPRPAYAAADVVIGMGTSSLRAMAYGKPVIVVGDRGFAMTFTPESAPSFLYAGLHGVGNGASDEGCLLAEMKRLGTSAELRSSLGRHSLAFVCEHYSLDAVCAGLSQTTREALALQPGRWSLSFDCLRTLAIYLRERRFLWRALDAQSQSSAPERSMPAHRQPIDAMSRGAMR